MLKKINAYTIFTIICSMFLLWIAASTIEAMTKNIDENPEYSSWNIWKMGVDAYTKPDHTQYTAYGRYYTEGTVITNDGNVWEYSTDVISEQTPTDNMPIWIAFDDNGTPDNIADDVVLGLVYDRETAIYDELEAALGDKFELERDGNNIQIGGIK